MVRAFFTEEDAMREGGLLEASMVWHFISAILAIFTFFCWLAFWGGVIYVAWHFISKFW